MPWARNCPPTQRRWISRSWCSPMPAGRTLLPSTSSRTCTTRADALTDLLSDPLVRLDKNFKVNPSAATEWTADDSGLVWTFKLDPKLMWNDGTPVTADDYVATFQYGADPKHAWDFNWYYSGVIKNWTQAVAGEVPVTDLGVKAVDANTLEFTTETPAPYLPAMLVYSTPLQKKALEANGGLYNSDPATSVLPAPTSWWSGPRTSVWCTRSTLITRAPTSRTSRS